MYSKSSLYWSDRGGVDVGAGVSTGGKVEVGFEDVLPLLVPALGPLRQPSFVIVLCGILTITHFRKFPYSFLTDIFCYEFTRIKICRTVTHLL